MKQDNTQAERLELPGGWWIELPQEYNDYEEFEYWVRDDRGIGLFVVDFYLEGAKWFAAAMNQNAPGYAGLREALDYVWEQVYIDGNGCYQFKDGFDLQVVIDALAQSPAQERRSAPLAWAYEFHEFGDVWSRHVILNRPDGGANPPTKHHGAEIRKVVPLYAAAPEAQERPVTGDMNTLVN